MSELQKYMTGISQVGSRSDTHKFTYIHSTHFCCPFLRGMTSNPVFSQTRIVKGSIVIDLMFCCRFHIHVQMYYRCITYMNRCITGVLHTWTGVLQVYYIHVQVYYRCTTYMYRCITGVLHTCTGVLYCSTSKRVRDWKVTGAENLGQSLYFSIM